MVVKNTAARMEARMPFFAVDNVTMLSPSSLPFFLVYKRDCSMSNSPCQLSTAK